MTMVSKVKSHLAVVNPESVRSNLDHLCVQTLTHLSATVRHQDCPVEKD